MQKSTVTAEDLKGEGHEDEVDIFDFDVESGP
jgi:hypothetical protein